MFARIKRLTWNASLLTTLISLLTFTVALAAAGNLDTSFSGDGRVATDFAPSDPGREDLIFGLAVQPNGKIVAVGYSYPGPDSGEFAVSRYNANGSLDTTFSGDGRLLTNFGATDQGIDVALQADGKIVVVGGTCADGNCDVALARYTTSGKLDTTFSGDGKVVTNFGTANNPNSASTIAIQPDGKIVVAGYVWDAQSNTYDFAIYRYNTNGSKDTSFSGDGVSFGHYDTDGTDDFDDYARDLVLQSDGKIIVVGTTGANTNRNFAIARLTANGSLDSTFSGDGILVTGFGGDDFGKGVALQSNGKIVAVGEKYDASTSLRYSAVVRFNSNGTLDTTFNGKGIRVFSVSAGQDSLTEDVIVQTDGKIVIVGTTGTSPAYFSLVRLNSNGSFDTTFSTDGKMKVNFGPSNEYGTVIALQPSDGKYVLGGYRFGSSWDFAIARVLP